MSHSSVSEDEEEDFEVGENALNFSLEELEPWLTMHGLQTHWPSFEESEVDLEAFIPLDADDFQDLSIPAGARIKFLRLRRHAADVFSGKIAAPRRGADGVPIPGWQPAAGTAPEPEPEEPEHYEEEEEQEEEVVEERAAAPAVPISLMPSQVAASPPSRHSAGGAGAAQKGGCTAPDSDDEYERGQRAGQRGGAEADAALAQSLADEEEQFEEVPADAQFWEEVLPPCDIPCCACCTCSAPDPAPATPAPPRPALRTPDPATAA